MPLRCAATCIINKGLLLVLALTRAFPTQDKSAADDYKNILTKTLTISMNENEIIE